MKVKIEKIEIKCYVSIVIFRITKKKNLITKCET